MNEYTETQTPLIEELWSKITTDDDLKEIMGGKVKLYYPIAEKDAEFPYLVHRLENNYDPEGMIVAGTYLLDIWSYSQTHEEALKIRGELIRILDKLKFTVGDEICKARLSLQTDGQIIEETEGIQHRAMQFNLRYDRKIEWEQILKRSDD